MLWGYFKETAYWLLECRHVILRKKNDLRNWYHFCRLVKRFYIEKSNKSTRRRENGPGWRQ